MFWFRQIPIGIQDNLSRGQYCVTSADPRPFSGMLLGLDAPCCARSTSGCPFGARQRIPKGDKVRQTRDSTSASVKAPKLGCWRYLSERPHDGRTAL